MIRAATAPRGGGTQVAPRGGTTRLIASGTSLRITMGVAESASTRFFRQLDLPGFEMFERDQIRRGSGCFCLGYELVATDDWQGEVWYRGQRRRIDQDSVFLVTAGHAYQVMRVERPGRWIGLTLDHSCLTPSARDGARGSRLTSLLVRSAMLRLLGLLKERAPDTSEIEATLWPILDWIARALADTEAPSSVNERTMPCASPELSARELPLPSGSGRNRYVRARSFKHRYGLPPHTYDLWRRVALAKQALRLGKRPCDVAAAFGFFDQSHLHRHFKRLVGLTPIEYARAARAEADGRRAEPSARRCP